jgi:hypothetical protein
MEAHAGFEKTDRQVSAQSPVALDEQRIGAGPRASDRRRDARDAAPDDDGVCLMRDRDVTSFFTMVVQTASPLSLSGLLVGAPHDSSTL